MRWTSENLRFSTHTPPTPASRPPPLVEESDQEGSGGRHPLQYRCTMTREHRIREVQDFTGVRETSVLFSIYGDP